MTIVSDTSPISYLVLIGAEEVLPAMYGQVITSEAVRRELGHPKRPEAVRSWIDSSPSWLSVRSIRSKREDSGSGRGEPSLQGLDSGEREAIVLVEQEQAGLLLIDEQAGRTVARNHGLEVAGTIGILGAAAKNGHVDAARVVVALRDTTFRASPDLYRWLLRQGQD